MFNHQETPRFCSKAKGTAQSPSVVERWELGTPAALPSCEISQLPAPAGQTRLDEIKAVCTALCQQFRAQPPFLTSTCSWLLPCVLHWPQPLHPSCSPWEYSTVLLPHCAGEMVLGMQHPKRMDDTWDTTPKPNFGKVRGKKSGFWGWDDGISSINAGTAGWEW